VADPLQMFAVPLWSGVLEGHEAHRDGLVGEILQHRAAEPGLQRSNRGGWHSGPAFLQSRHPSIAWLLQALVGYARRELAPRYQGWARHELKLGSYWATVLDAGGWHAPHHHLPQHWSMVFYVAAGAPGDGGTLEFLNPEPSQTLWGNGNVAVTPKDGLVLLFPSSTVHLVHPHTGAAPRITIAANLDAIPKR
jgi:uncharacterized protein (TIGR02466 family)